MGNKLDWERANSRSLGRNGLSITNEGWYKAAIKKKIRAGGKRKAALDYKLSRQKFTQASDLDLQVRLAKEVVPAYTGPTLVKRETILKGK